MTPDEVAALPQPAFDAYLLGLVRGAELLQQGGRLLASRIVRLEIVRLKVKRQQMERRKKTMPDELPEVECSGCGRRAKCIQVSDGTVYRPFAWSFPDENKPLCGLCSSCLHLLPPGERKKACAA